LKGNLLPDCLVFLQQKLQAILSLFKGDLSNSGLSLMLLFFKRKFYQKQPEKSTVFGVQMGCECTADPGGFHTEQSVATAVTSDTKICVELEGVRAFDP